MFMTVVWSCLELISVFFVWSYTVQSFCWDRKVVMIRNNIKLWPLCRFSPLSLFRSLGLPPSPSRTPCRVWKPPRGQLHRAAECAGSPRAQPHTTWRHTVRSRKPARSKSRGTSTRVTATGKSFCHPTKPLKEHRDIQYIDTCTHGCKLHTKMCTTN